jgi:DNA-binding GntR family transcriptional regulator
MQAAAGSADRHEVAVHDAAFHARLIGLAGNRTLERVWRSLEPFSRTYITLVSPGADAQWTADLHPRILAAVRSRDPEAVVVALRHHFDEASAHLADGWIDDAAEVRRPRAGSGRSHAAATG